MINSDQIWYQRCRAYTYGGPGGGLCLHPPGPNVNDCCEDEYPAGSQDNVYT